MARWRSVAGGRRSSSPTAQASSATRRVCSSVERSLRGEADHQRAHARAEERLLGADELGGGEVADQRARGPPWRRSSTAGIAISTMPSSSIAWPK